MKRILISTALLLMGIMYGNLLGGSLQMFYTEPFGYPYLTTGFKLFDAQGNQIRNSQSVKPIKKTDVIVTELVNGQVVQRQVLTDPDCPSQTLTTFSAVLTVDISQSMSEPLPNGTTRIDAAKEVLRQWAKKFDSKRTETAITAFCGDAMASVDFPDLPIRAFTTDKDSLLDAINKMPNICAGTNYNAAFLYKRFETFIKHYSAMHWCRPDVAKYKPVIVFLTDGNHLSDYGGPIDGGRFNISEVNRLALERKVTIYVIQFGTETITPENLSHLNALSNMGKSPSDQSPNIWMGVNSATELEGIYDQILKEAGTLGDPPPCYVTWKGACEGGSATFTFPNHGGLVGVSDYVVAPGKFPNLNINPRNVNFSDIAPGSESSKTITLKAEKNFVEIEGIDVQGASLAGEITVTDWGPKGPPPFTIDKDSSYKIVIKFKPTDSLCSSGIVEFLGSACTGREMNVKGELQPFVEKINMGNVNIGKSDTLTFTSVFCNKTCQVINITSKPKIIGTDAANFSVLKPTGTIKLNSGDCLEMEFRFAPSEPAGTKTAKIEIRTDYNGNQTFNGDITGNAIGGKTVTHIDPGFDSTGCNTASVENKITLENAGVETITISNCVIQPNTDNFEIKNSTWPTTLAGGASGDVTIIFHPTNPAKQNADYTATLVVTSDADNPTYNIPLTGPMRNIDFTLSSAVNFGEVCVGTPQTRQVTLTNTGNVPLNVNASSTVPFQPANTSYNVPVGGNVPIDVQCNPLTDAAFNANLSITNTECNLTKTVALTAMGVYPSISFDQDVNLTATVGSSDAIDVVVTNESTSPVTITGITPCDDRFTITNITPPVPPNATIQPGNTITLTVTYTPDIGDATLLNSCIHFTGTTCNFDTNVAITGNPGAATVDIEIDDHTGYDGDPINIPVLLRNGSSFDKSNTTKVSAEIRYDSSLLEVKSGFTVRPDVGTFKIITLTDKPVLSVNTPQAVDTLKFTIRKTGTATSTPLEIISASGNGGAGFIRKDGLFTLSEAAAVLKVDTVAALVGTEIKVKVHLQTGTPLPGDNTDKITLVLSFDGTVLEPTDKPPKLERTFDKATRKWIATYKLPIAPTSGDVLSELSFNTMIGLASETVLKIDSVGARGGKLTPVNGLYKALGLCQDGENDDIRFFNPDVRAKINAINPNPADGMITLEYETAEEGSTKLWISDMLGNHVMELYNAIPKPGKAKADFDGSQLPNGVYFIILQTPTQTVREKIYIMR